MNKNVYSVGQVNSYIRNMFDQDFMLRSISVRGEVSNCKYHSSGHIYFTLKDGSGVLKCVMFKTYRSGLPFPMKEGQRLVVSGNISVYERDGAYQLYAKEVLLDGIGQLYEEYERLKRNLEEQGLFSPEYKRKIPRYSFRIGVVTASTGAAIRDIVNISSRRNPYVQLYLYPAKVQGEGAAESIIEGLEALDDFGVDCIIVGRGGGSIEDLWAFNDEGVAWAIFNCATPVISAVGHEVDYTIADYVADLRAPTPSAAAELAVFDIRLFDKEREEKKQMLVRFMERIIQKYRDQVNRGRLQLGYYDPARQIEKRRQDSAALEERLCLAMNRTLEDRKGRLALLCARLDGLSPLKKLGGGYAYVEDLEEKPVCSVTKVKREEEIRVVLKDGAMKARVLEISKGEPWKKQ